MAKTTRRTKTQVLPAEIPAEPSVSEGLRRNTVLPKLGILFLLLLGLLLWKNKHLFLAASVNGQLITRSQLNRLLTSKYGTQTLSNLITQTIVEQEINKQGIAVTQTQIDTKLSEVKSNLPQGLSFEQALNLQGISQSEFESQLRLQLAIEKALEDKIKVEPEEIKNYIKDNRKLMSATDSSSLETEARETLRQKKLDQEIAKWIEKLQTEAKVIKYETN